MSKFYDELAEIFEIDPAQVNPQFELAGADAQWDSLALVSVIALVDDCFNVMLDGTALMACKTIGDIEVLIEQAKS